MKKLYALLLVMLFMCMPAYHAFAFDSGSCGTNVKYVIFEDDEVEDSCTLVIEGTGAMTNWSSSAATPWAGKNVVCVVINEGVTSIGDYAFMGMTSLKELMLPDSLTRIGNRAFHSTGLTGDIVIPANVTEISNYAFNFTAISSISFAEGSKLTELKRGAFRENKNLTSVKIPSSVTKVGEETSKGSYSVLENSSNLHTLCFTSESAPTFSSKAFENAADPLNVYYPSSWEKFDTTKTYGATGTVNWIQTKSNVSALTDTISYFFTDNGKTLNFVGTGNMPVASSDSNCTYGKTGYTKVIIGEGITAVGTLAFGTNKTGESNIASVILPSTLERIDAYAFLNCDGLKNVTYAGTQNQWKKVNLDSSNIALYSANFTYQKISLTYDLNGGSCEGETTVIFDSGTDGKTYDLTLTPTRAGYIFIGWTIDDESEITDTIIMTDKDRTVTAQWKNEHSLIKTDSEPPTCVRYGNDTYYTCTDCGKYFSDEEGTKEIEKDSWVIDFLAPHTEVIDAAVAATCTKTGLTEGSHCLVCNTEIKDQQTVDALGHKEVTDVAEAATCTETGLSEGSHCSRCNTVIKAQETVDALGHKEVTDAAVAATTESSGLTEGSHCSVCDTVIKKQEYVPILLSIITQPSTVTKKVDTTAKFTVKATGEGLTYQWQYRSSSTGVWKNCSSTTAGYNTEILKPVASAKRNGYQYRCIIKDVTGETCISETVTLKVFGITTQPADQTVVENMTAEFTVVATNAESYQWQYRTSVTGTWRDCSSATEGYNTATLKPVGAINRNGYQYRCIIKDASGNKLTSNKVTLTIFAITSQPSSKTINEGETAEFKVVATGAATYQWQYKTPTGDWKNCSSATNGYNVATLLVEGTAARNGYKYRCIIMDAAGNKLTSKAVKLTVNVITSQPVSQTVKENETALFSIEAPYAASFKWQYRTSETGTWRDCSSATSGYNTAVLEPIATAKRNGYQYRCIIINSAGKQVVSNVVTLSVI